MKLFPLTFQTLGQEFASRVIPPELQESFLRPEAVKFVSNNERRVKQTAEEFARGFLSSDSATQLVLDTKETSRILGDISRGKTFMDHMKKRLSEMMHSENPKEYFDVSPKGLQKIGNPLQTMKELTALMEELCSRFDPEGEYCEGEIQTMVEQRWRRLIGDFFKAKTQTFDTTKIPDIFDYSVFDILHNRNSIKDFDQFPLFQKSEAMARFVVPEEYGIDSKDKFDIGSLVCEPLVRKIYQDMQEIAKGASDKGRFYFSSESHLHTLRNLLLHSGVTNFFPLSDHAWELNYLTHIVFKLYENFDVPEEDPKR